MTAKGMSDLCMYELADIAWEEFDQTDDHIVPHPSDEQTKSRPFKGDSRKKPRLEVIEFSNSAAHNYAAKSSCPGKGQIDSSTLTKGKTQMLEEDPWSGSPNGMFHASCDSDSIKDRTSLESDNTMISSQCFKTSNMNSIGNEFSADVPIPGQKCAAADSDSYNYLPSHISQTGDDLGFLEDSHEDKESRDLLYFGWPDIGNFDDIDRMFRSCDSTFGLEAVGNEDEIGWFSSSNIIEGSENSLKPELKFLSPESSETQNILENHDSVKPDDLVCSTKDFSMKNGSDFQKESSKKSDNNESAPSTHISFSNGCSRVSQSKDEVLHKQQASLTKKDAKQQNPSEGKAKGQHLEHASFCYNTVNVQNKDAKHPSQDPTGQVFNSVGVQLPRQGSGHDSFGYFQGNGSYNGHSLGDIAVSPTLSCIKSESNGLTSLSTKESSYASNLVHSLDNSHDLSFRVNVGALSDKRRKLHCHKAFQQTFTSNPQQVKLGSQASRNPVSMQKQAHYDGSKFENHSDVEGTSTEHPGELDSSNAQESSSLTSGLDEITLEATSFRQLQLVMEKMHLKEKLCIRDSLYRLARSAEQRHNNADHGGISADDKDTSRALTAEGTHKCHAFVDVETDTNPIDRSIAHLLFHRPLDSAVMPAYDASSHKSHAMIHGSINRSPVMDEMLCQEETAGETDRSVVDH